MSQPSYNFLINDLHHSHYHQIELDQVVLPPKQYYLLYPFQIFITTLPQFIGYFDHTIERLISDMSCEKLNSLTLHEG